jgi:putative transposase
VDHAQEQGLSERWACRLVNQPRGTQRYQPTQREDEDILTKAIVALASQYGRYGFRRVTALLQQDGWQVGKDRVERIWRREGLKVSQMAETARTTVVERRIVRSSTARAQQPCVEL